MGLLGLEGLALEFTGFVTCGVGGFEFVSLDLSVLGLWCSFWAVPYVVYRPEENLNCRQILNPELETENPKL